MVGSRRKHRRSVVAPSRAHVPCDGRRRDRAVPAGPGRRRLDDVRALPRRRRLHPRRALRRHVLDQGRLRGVPLRADADVGRLRDGGHARHLRGRRHGVRRAGGDGRGRRHRRCARPSASPSSSPTTAASAGSRSSPSRGRRSEPDLEDTAVSGVRRDRTHPELPRPRDRRLRRARLRRARAVLRRTRLRDHARPLHRRASCATSRSSWSTSSSGCSPASCPRSAAR